MEILQCHHTKERRPHFKPMAGCGEYGKATGEAAVGGVRQAGRGAGGVVHGADRRGDAGEHRYGHRKAERQGDAVPAQPPQQLPHRGNPASHAYLILTACTDALSSSSPTLKSICNICRTTHSKVPCCKKVYWIWVGICAL